jgi:hypothetical protein
MSNPILDWPQKRRLRQELLARWEALEKQAHAGMVLYELSEGHREAVTAKLKTDIEKLRDDFTTNGGRQICSLLRTLTRSPIAMTEVKGRPFSISWRISSSCCFIEASCCLILFRPGSLCAGAEVRCQHRLGYDWSNHGPAGEPIRFQPGDRVLA